jgi:hypothetical protein
MADINDSKVMRFDYGGVIKIGSDELRYIKSGALRYNTGKQESQRIKERGKPAQWISGDEDVSEITLDMYVTSNPAIKIETALFGVAASDRFPGVTATGAPFTFTLVVEHFETVNGTRKKTLTFENCVADRPSYTEGGENDGDSISVRIRSLTANPTIVYAAVV